MDNRIFLRFSMMVGVLGCLFLWFYSATITSDVSLIPDLIYTEDDYHHDAGRIYKDLAVLAERRNDLNQALKLYQISLSHSPDSQELQERLVVLYKMLSNSQTQLAQNIPPTNDK